MCDALAVRVRPPTRRSLLGVRGAAGAAAGWQSWHWQIERVGTRGPGSQPPILIAPCRNRVASEVVLVRLFLFPCMHAALLAAPLLLLSWVIRGLSFAASLGNRYIRTANSSMVQRTGL
jgi:hypothetical protein